MQDKKMLNIKQVPFNSYGVLNKNIENDSLGNIIEQVRHLGYAILNAGLSKEVIFKNQSSFNIAYDNYITRYNYDFLESIDEHNTIRMPMVEDFDTFFNLALNKKILNIISRLIDGKFILNQQNAIINPSQKNYNQGKWHRDLPYQHFTSSKPLAINVIYCVDDFTEENGSTWVLPASHKFENFPSSNYINENAVQLHANAGSYILIDCMTFHSGGFNNSIYSRRAVNQVYTIPYFKQQIPIFKDIKHKKSLTDEEKTILGFNDLEIFDVTSYLHARMKK